MQWQYVGIEYIKPNPDNPRIIRDDKFNKLVHSIKNFPQMLELRPIVVNEAMQVLGGNMRLRACEAAKLTKIPVVIASSLTAEQQREFIIKDNVSFGEWDWDVLANAWDIDTLHQWGVDIPTFPEPENANDDVTTPALDAMSYQVVIECKSDIEQANIARELEDRGYTCRLLTL
jgi:hypothetical protein